MEHGKAVSYDRLEELFTSLDNLTPIARD